MRIVVQDHAGHPFQVELSRELARRGHEVLHLYCGAVVGPRGDLAQSRNDPPTLTIEAVPVGETFEKYSARRLWDEVRYGTKVAARIRKFDPRAVLSANAPLLSQRILLAESRHARRRFILWWQDSYGIGAQQVFARRSALLARGAGGAAIWLERTILRGSDAVIGIAPSMASLAIEWGVDPKVVEVIPNWAPLGEGAPPRANADPPDARPVVLYAGTLGLKHDPEILLGLARKLDEATVLVVSEGPGRDALEAAKAREPLPQLVLSDYLPVQELPAVLARSAVFIVLLRGDAGAFSVPSKVLTYLAAGKPIVGSLPTQNASAEVLRISGAGTVVEPDDLAGLVEAVRHYLRDPIAAEAAGRAGLRYAEDNFVIGPIADRFEVMIKGPTSAPSHARAGKRRSTGRP